MNKIKIEHLLFLVTIFLSLGQSIDLKTMPADTAAPAEDLGMGMPEDEDEAAFPDEMEGSDEMGMPAQTLPVDGGEPAMQDFAEPASSMVEQPVTMEQAPATTLLQEQVIQTTPEATMPASPETAPPSVPDSGAASLAFVPETKASPTGEIPVTSPSIPTQPDPFRQEWEQIKNDVEGIDQLEIKVLEQLRQLDDSLDNAMDESVNARKLSVEMLNITDEASAQASLNKLKEHLNKVKQIQMQVQQEFTKNFDVTLTEIQTKMQAVQDRVKILEKQGLITKTELEKRVTVEVPPVEEIIEKEEESYWFQKGVAAVATTIRLIKKAVGLVTSFVSNIATWTRKVIEKGVSQSADEGAPVLPSGVAPGPGVAPPPELSAPVPQSQPAALQQVSPEMQAMEQGMAEMQQGKVQIAQAREKLKQVRSERSDQLQKKITLIEEKLGTKLSEEKKEKLTEILVTKRTGWRGEIEYLFGKVLDLLTYMGKKIRLVANWFYEDFLKKRFRKFLFAVEKRVGEIEQEERGDKKAVSIEVAVPGAPATLPAEAHRASAEMGMAPPAPVEAPASMGMESEMGGDGGMMGSPDEVSPYRDDMMGGGGMGEPGETGPPSEMGM